MSGPAIASRDGVGGIFDDEPKFSAPTEPGSWRKRELCPQDGIVGVPSAYGHHEAPSNQRTACEFQRDHSPPCRSRRGTTQHCENRSPKEIRHTPKERRNSERPRLRSQPILLSPGNLVATREVLTYLVQRIRCHCFSPQVHRNSVSAAPPRSYHRTYRLSK